MHTVETRNVLYEEALEKNKWRRGCERPVFYGVQRNAELSFIVL